MNLVQVILVADVHVAWLVYIGMYNLCPYCDLGSTLVSNLEQLYLGEANNANVTELHE